MSSEPRPAEPVLSFVLETPGAAARSARRARCRLIATLAAFLLALITPSPLEHALSNSSPATQSFGLAVDCRSLPIGHATFGKLCAAQFPPPRPRRRFGRYPAGSAECLGPSSAMLSADPARCDARHKPSSRERLASRSARSDRSRPASRASMTRRQFLVSSRRSVGRMARVDRVINGQPPIVQVDPWLARILDAWPRLDDRARQLLSEFAGGAVSLIGHDKSPPGDDASG